MTLEEMYGPMTLTLIMVAIPMLLQLWKMITGWQDKAMLITSVIVTYLLVDLYYLGTTFRDNPYPKTWEGFFILLGVLLYPLMVWFGTQGIYSLFIKNSAGQERLRLRNSDPQ